MISRIACVAIAGIGAMALLPPVKVYAKGFFGAAASHGVHAHHVFRHRHNNGWIAIYPDYVEPGIPTQIAPAYTAAPQCKPSVETVTVPAEGGGERQITIRRCSPY